jgi:tetratricopeptide (TPR) repeat protein
VTGPKRLTRSLYLRREPVTLALLTGLAIAAFLAVTGLSRIHTAQQESLAERWSGRGSADLAAHRYRPAVAEFRAALRYSRDSYDYQLSLAQALLGLNRIDEADAYLVNLWDREPENGLVNLELARIAAQKGQTQHALRFYHNAIYATWPGDQEISSRNARLELINYLLRIQANAQAQAELIALAANLGDDPAMHEYVGELFLRVQDNQHAFSSFLLALKKNPSNEAALAGAGVAAFHLGLYPTALIYLQSALQLAPGDSQSAELMRKTEFALEFDPFREQLSTAERDHIVINAFATAGKRLLACGSNAAPQDLVQQWNKLKPQITEDGLRRNPDLVNTAMSIAINIERKTTGVCGAPSDQDSALLLIADLHEEN